MDLQSENNDVSPMVAANELEMIITRDLPDSSSHTPKRKTKQIEISGNSNEYSSSKKDKIISSIDKQIEATIKKMTDENQDDLSHYKSENYVPHDATHTSQSNSRNGPH